MSRSSPAISATALTLGLAFLYLPIVILVVYSFNASRLVTVWGGFSVRWYEALWHDRQLIDAALLSLGVGALSATLATILGTAAALKLNRRPSQPTSKALALLVYVPLVLPEVITGLSLLLLFVALDMERGFWTVTLAHATFTMCFATVVVQSRLAGFDMALEEAAQDLGARPEIVFVTVTLPLIFPGIAAAWLLAFTLSLDDLVVASFTTGPGATTLPMRIYSAVRLGVSPEINAACSVLIGVVTLAVTASSLAAKRGAR